jgi:hypothetical protein
MESNFVKGVDQNIQNKESGEQQSDGNLDQNNIEDTPDKNEHKQESESSRKSEEQSK